jgi:hypothetical protein
MKKDTNPDKDILQFWTSSWAAQPLPWLHIGDTRRLARLIAIGLVVMMIALGLGRSTPTAFEQRSQIVGAIVGQWSFDLLAWEIEAVSEKIANTFRRPDTDLSVTEEVALVRQFIEDANRLGLLEAEINGLLSTNIASADATVEELQAELATLRAQQQERRPLVETIIQDQVSAELAVVGFGLYNYPLPPVWFTFVEPPKKLVASPRDRIITVYSRMLTEGINPTQAEISEAAIFQATNLRAYITNIGGLGAFPTMVVDRASLPWIFNTVAHEWTHNYLTLFPLGLRYNISSELITLNETVAEIVGDEIGTRVVERYYPEFSPPDPSVAPTAAEGSEVLPMTYRPLPFNFDREMRETRQRVDGLLAAGFIETAEYYMEARRQFFVANGYPLRVLNQAYFAFHGSYGTSAASTSPIGPKLQALRAQSEDLPGFLHTVRWFTSSQDLDRALRE